MNIIDKTKKYWTGGIFAKLYRKFAGGHFTKLHKNIAEPIPAIAKTSKTNVNF